MARILSYHVFARWRSGGAPGTAAASGQPDDGVARVRVVARQLVGVDVGQGREPPLVALADQRAEVRVGDHAHVAGARGVDADGVEQLACVAAARDHGARRVEVEALDHQRLAEQARQPVPPVGRERECAHGCLGEPVVRHPPAGAARQLAAGADHAGEHRLCRFLCRALDRLQARGRIVAAELDVQHEDRVDLPVVEQSGDRLQIVVDGRPHAEVERVAEPVGARQRTLQPRAGVRARRGERQPRAAHASAATTPRPPEFVTTPIRRPRGSGWDPKSSAALKSACVVSTRSTPAWKKSASVAASPSARPPFTARIGLRRATRRETCEKRRGLPNDSM
jgi:hypothetical protein